MKSCLLALKNSHHFPARKVAFKDKRRAKQSVVSIHRMAHMAQPVMARMENGAIFPEFEAFPNEGN
jgi:hypothetical protein